MLLELTGIQKRFGGVTALRDGNLAVDAGEAHLLLGENGAGKSTLMKIVAGMQPPDGGRMQFRGETVHFSKPADAARVGIAMVHQESLLAPHLTVAENIFLGREPRLPFGWVSRKKMLEAARRVIADNHFPLQAEWRVDKLSPAGKQMVEICRAIQHGSSLMIFDEPTSSLSDHETQEVFRIVNQLRQRGMGVIYITHRLEELRTVGDRVTILRDGETVHTGEMSAITNDEIIRHMVGRELGGMYERHPVTPGEPMLEVEGITRHPVLHNVSLTVRAGEIVGLAGLIGAGRTELCRVIFGLDHADKGTIKVAGRPVTIHNPRQAVAQRVALIPEDRQRAGLATALPIGYNLTVASMDKVSRLGWLIDGGAEKRLAAEYIARLRIRCDSPKQLSGRLSGGNQQKVVIAKWLLRGAKVFLFDEPTRGIDVGAKVEVYEVMDQLAQEGAAILMVSSELPELLQVADRILVMRQGSISGELPGHTTQEEIMKLATLHDGGATLEESAE